MAQCEMPDKNPASEQIKAILSQAKTIAIVGLSGDPTKDSNKVARYLLEQNYEVIPVNPNKQEILGLQSYADISAIPFVPDIVDIFRKTEAISAITDEAIKKGVKAIWMQLGLTDNLSAQKAHDAGIEVVQSKCIMQEHKRYSFTEK